jgi:hypothetical protein
MKLARILVLAVMIFALTGTSHAWFLDFEWGLGHDYEQIQSGIPGLTFASDMFYADAMNGAWNFSSYDLGLAWYSQEYWINGYVGAHASSNGIGRIDFANADGSWFTTGYCAGNTFYVEAYDINDNLLDVASGAANRRYLESNPNGPGFLTVSSGANNIAYVILHDGGYFWVADDMSGDASGVYDPSIPEPTTMALLGLGLLGMGAGLRKRMKK